MAPDSAAAQASSHFARGRSGYPFPKRACFNCEDEECSLERCPKPRDEARIERNRAKFRAAQAAARASRQRGGRGGHGRGNDPRGRGSGRGAGRGAHTVVRKTKTVDGVQYVLNKNKQWVLDQKKVREDQKKALVAELTGLQSQLNHYQSQDRADPEDDPDPYGPEEEPRPKTKVKDSMKHVRFGPQTQLASPHTEIQAAQLARIQSLVDGTAQK